ncbi:hypothetical protein C0Q70_13567 [Pomacea canaliculata]|uniref:Endonuclease/exonuclease/phosphatase domain-containing protein n=1 Tax=Pomacea canaliculata TaxID=400727 RepID=A0A2T7NXN4_POMCA|nr:hypothetical protein C0Q70_13567 [Pomacea canaliculata]
MACSVVILRLKSVRPSGSHTSSIHRHNLLLQCLKTAGLVYEEPGGLSSDVNIGAEEVSSTAAAFKKSGEADVGSYSKTAFDITKRTSRRHAATSQQKHTGQNADHRSGDSCNTVAYECGLPSYWEKSAKIPSGTTYHAHPGGSQVVSYPLSSIQAKCSLSSAGWSPVRQCHTASQIMASTHRHQLWAEEKIHDGEQAKSLQKQKFKDEMFVEKKSSSAFAESKGSIPYSSDIHEARCSEMHSPGDTGCRIDESEKWNLECRKLEMLPRRWEDTWLGKKTKSLKLNRQKKQKTQEVEFTIMTYNILAQRLLEDHHHLYGSSSLSATDWNLRRHRLIVNLQEVQSDDFKDYLLPELEKLGYSGVYEKRKGDKCDGCATLWQNRKFRLLRSTPVDYCRGGLLDRNNIALLVELQPCRKLIKHHLQEGEDKILVANTHILFNPRRGDIKLAQLMVLLAEIDKHAYLGPREVQPKRYLQYEGQLIRAMSGQEEGQYGNNRTLEQNFFSSDYGIGYNCQYSVVVQQRAQHHINSCLLQSHTPKGRSAERSMASKEVDSHHGRQMKLRQVKEGCLKLLGRYGLMSAQELGRLGGIPNTTLASDHSCLIAKFLLT